MDTNVPLTTGTFDPDIVRRTLRQARLDKGLGQEDVAAMLGEVKSTLWRFENEAVDPKFDMVVKLAWVLNIPLVDLARAVGLRVRGSGPGRDDIDDPRLRVALDRLLSDPDEAWRQHIITTLSMLTSTRQHTSAACEGGPS